MSGVKLPSAAEVTEIERVRNRILDAVADERSFVVVAHAALLVWAGILRVDGGITRENAKNVASAVIDHYIRARGN